MAVNLVDGRPSPCYKSAMNFDNALRRYREGEFGDDDVTRCTGLAVRAWRELIKIGAVRTVTTDRGAGRVRLCDANTLRRAAIIAELNRARFSLAVSGRIAYFMPLDTLLYAIWDPCRILLQPWADVDPNTGLPPRIQQPMADWFDPDKPAKADPEDDWLIEIYEGRFIAISYGAKHEDEPWIYGDLRNDGTSFVSWFPFHQLTQVSSATEEIAKALLPYKIRDIVPKWEHPLMWSDRLNPDFLDYKYEDHGGDDDPLRLAAKATARSPSFKTTVNVTLAVRKALRRYLGIEPAARASELEWSQSCPATNAGSST
jgi:hypothetical protein